MRSECLTNAKILYLTLSSYQHGNKERAFGLIRAVKPLRIGFSKKIFRKMRESKKFGNG